MSTDNIVTVELEDGTEKKIYVRKPTNKDKQSADIYKAKIWMDCCKQGVTTAVELEEFLEKHNIWGSSQQEKYNALIGTMGELERELYTSQGKKSIQDGKDIVEKMKETRAEIHELIGKKTNLEQNTAEALSENARFDFLVAACLYDEKNEKRLYEDVDDYNNRSDDPVAFAGATKLAQFTTGLDPNFFKNLPENKWLAKFRLVNDDLQFINKEGKTVDSEGREINEFGQYVNSEGKITDKDGNLLEEDGQTYVLTADYSDKESQKRGRPKKTS